MKFVLTMFVGAVVILLAAIAGGCSKEFAFVDLPPPLPEAKKFATFERGTIYQFKTSTGGACYVVTTNDSVASLAVSCP